MGQITSGVGLVSGIDTASLIDQLLAVESRPKKLLANRSTILNSQQVAFQELNAKALAFKLSAGSLANPVNFKSTTATSSNESVLTASSTRSAVPGTYSFTVDRLVSTQQVITRGFVDADQTPVGEGTMTFEFGQGRLDANTDLRHLNGGEGVARGNIRITDRSGASAIVDLSKALTVDDVLKAVRNASGINVTARVGGDGLVIEDATGAAVTSLRIEDVGATGTATSLGIAGTAAGATLTGTSINTMGRETRLAVLNDQNGVRTNKSQNDLQITARDGSAYNVALGSATTLGEVIDAINTATGDQVLASVSDDGTGLKLTDQTGGGSAMTVAAVGGSMAASDLGLLGSDDGAGVIEGERIVANLNSKLLNNLNGGAGVNFSSDDRIQITNRAGVTTDVDLTGARSVDEVIARINDAGAGVTASLNRVGNGLLLTDTTSATAGDLIVGDLSGTLATDLNLAGSHDAASVDTGNMQVRYLSEATRLDSLNGGLGIKRGSFTITDSAGVSATIDLTQGDEVTLRDVLNEINSRGLQVNARINGTGDGVLIEDTGPGNINLTVAEAGSTTARDLGILGTTAEPGDSIDGSFEKTITIEAADTLEMVRDKINDAGLKISAGIINDGSGANAFRLSLQSSEPGRAGAFLLDSGDLDLKATTLVEARDAVVFFGSPDPAQAIAITSPKNQLTKVIPGATVDLHSSSEMPVSVTISRDDETIAEDVGKFVENFNAIIELFDKHDSYDDETKKRGLLLGDPTIARIRSSMYRLINGRNNDVNGQFTTLAQVGLTIGEGAKLKLDEEKFRAALQTDREAVVELFSLRETETDPDTNVKTTVRAGTAVKFDELLKGITDSTTGVLQNRLNSLDSQMSLIADRIEQFDKLLEAKRQRLERQFAAMESALADMQGQGSALATLQNLASQAQQQ